MCLQLSFPVGRSGRCPGEDIVPIAEKSGVSGPEGPRRSGQVSWSPPAPPLGSQVTQ